MKIKQIFEDENILPNTESFVERFKNCSFYHGSKMNISGDTIVDFKLRSEPRDTFLPIHNRINSFTNEKFGIPVRSLLFTSQKPQSVYGNLYEIIPIGSKFRVFVNTEVKDLTVKYDIEKGDVSGTIANALYGYKNDYGYDLTNKVKRNINQYKLIALSTFTEVRAYIKEVVNETVDDENTKRDILEIFESTISNYELIADEYVSNLKEVSEFSDLGYDLFDHEIMLYAPDNFYAKRKTDEN